MSLACSWLTNVLSISQRAQLEQELGINLLVLTVDDEVYTKVIKSIPVILLANDVSIETVFTFITKYHRESKAYIKQVTQAIDALDPYLGCNIPQHIRSTILVVLHDMYENELGSKDDQLKAKELHSYFGRTNRSGVSRIQCADTCRLLRTYISLLAPGQLE